MPAQFSQYEEMKRFLDFGEADAANLKAMAPVFAKHGGRITDSFYDTLGGFPITAKLIEGRVDALRATHARWMGELFAGDYGEAYFDNRVRIGEAHVRIGLPPFYVEGVMNTIRTHGQLALHTEVPDKASEYTSSLLKILDLDLIIINLAYSEERLDRVSSFTGMSRKLIENVVNRAKK